LGAPGVVLETEVAAVGGGFAIGRATPGARKARDRAMARVEAMDTFGDHKWLLSTDPQGDRLAKLPILIAIDIADLQDGSAESRPTPDRQLTQRAIKLVDGFPSRDSSCS